VMAERWAAEWEQSLDKYNFFGPDTRFVKNISASAWDFERGWNLFESSLKTETRYFNKSAEHLLTSIFEGIHGYYTRLGRSAILEAGPRTDLTRLYRAREFQSERELREAIKRPDLEVGPPPTARAVAGRMNAAGIAVFYGATDPDVALAEVRPPVGCKVLIGCFEIIRPLKLLDLSALNDLRDDEGSLFDELYRRRIKRAKFLRGLSWRLSKAVLPNDQPTEYLPTQAIADFLASAECPPLPLDGIVYPSVQAGYPGPGGQKNGLLGMHRKEHFNVVLFHKAAHVQPLDNGEDINVSDDSLYMVPGYLNDGPDVQYTVWIGKSKNSSPQETDSDDSTLKFSSLEVRYVKAVKFETGSSSIPRYSAPEKPEQEKET